MYGKRIKIFVVLIAALLLVCLYSLVQMQLLSGSFYRGRITKLKLQRGLSKQLKTVRGKILDRKGKILAVDEPQCRLHVSYELTCYMDERVQRAKLLKASPKDNSNIALSNVREELDKKLGDLQQIIDKCAQFRGVEPSQIKNEIQKINDFVWDRRAFQAWRNNFPNSEVFENYNDIIGIPFSEAIADFEKKEPDPVKRLRLVNKVDIAEMHKVWPLLELKTDDDIFAAQLEFMDVDGVVILPRARRFYLYGSVAAQTIGWVGPAQEQDKKLFADDKLSSYLDDEVCGRRPGVEYVCETILRGKRGKLDYDIDRRLISRTETQFGKDVLLTLDIELQREIENYLADCDLNPNCKVPTAAVVIDIATGDILALVSMPVFDLNRIRYDYDDIVRDPNEPLRNRAIYKQFPPGSVVKPLILIAGLETGKISPDEVIDCPAQKAPKGWPSCWIYNRHQTGHSGMWLNDAHNAIKGSCNIYFSRLADRIDPSLLQQWLLKFGYGREILFPPADIIETGHDRNLMQAPGRISTATPDDLEQLPPIEKWERRYFGMGQGNLRATLLQVANSMAAIARGGVLKQPRLFKETRNSEGMTLGVSPQTLDIVRDGMNAVVNEPGGTAYREFAPARFAEQGINVYGKTGSTEEPDNAWFAGFAEDRTGRSIAIAVAVEGGQHGSSDAAPLARDIIQFCIEAQYIGQ